MAQSHDFWISVSLNGVQAFILETGNKTVLTLIASSRIYSPSGRLPSKHAQCSFGKLYWKMEGFGFKGPYDKNNEFVRNGFTYTHELSRFDLLRLLEKEGIAIRVREIPHQGNETKVQEVCTELSTWIDSETRFEPNPKIEENEKYSHQMKRLEKVFTLEDRLWKYICQPLLVISAAIFGYGLIANYWLALVGVLLSILVVVLLFVWVAKTYEG